MKRKNDREAKRSLRTYQSHYLFTRTENYLLYQSLKQMTHLEEIVLPKLDELPPLPAPGELPMPPAPGQLPMPPHQVLFHYRECRHLRKPLHVVHAAQRHCERHDFAKNELSVCSEVINM